MKLSITTGILLILGAPALLAASLTEAARGLKTALDGQTIQKAEAGAPPTVLFVCEHGAAKSVIAAAEFNRLAEERGLAWRAGFRGTNPEASIAPAVTASLARDGLHVQGQPSLVTAADVASATHVVTFANSLPVAVPSGRIRDWNDVPSTSADLAAAREAIRLRVVRLLDELAPSPVAWEKSKKE